MGEDKVSPSEIHKQLEILTNLGMVERLPSERGARTVDYVRADSPAWEIVAMALRVTAELYPPQSSGELSG